MNNRQTKKERGAVVVEATLLLPMFMFFMITLYSVVQIAYVQARMTVALDAATKQIAEYAHVYFATGMDGTFKSGEGASSQIANQVSEFLVTMGGRAGSVDDEFGEFVTGAGKAMAGDNLADLAKDGAGTLLAEQMMKKNMISGFNDNADAFMKRNRIENFNMMGSKVLENNSKDIFLKVNYDIQVIKLLNIDYKFHMGNCAYTQAWSGE